MKTNLSLNGSKEYCCTVVKINDLTPVAGSDFLATTLIDNLPIIVRKDEVKIGDIMLYASNETQLSNVFLSANNLYDVSHRDMNENYADIKDLSEDEQKKYVGFFGLNGRVRTIKLRGVQSFGFLFKPIHLEHAYKLDQIHWDERIGTCFDTVEQGGKTVKFIKAYVPSLPDNPMNNRKRTKGAQHKVDKIDRVIPGEFAFHYDTQPLAKSIEHIKPDDKVTISVKLHGTSFIFANVKCNIPLKLPFYKKVWNEILPKRFNTEKTVEGYDELYASRTVLKNRWARDDKDRSYYEKDVYGHMASILHGCIPEGFTVYGEIIGYLPDSSTYVQKGYDYKCPIGSCKLMIYRVVQEIGDKHVEYNPMDVAKFTQAIMHKYPDLNYHLMALPILYHGTLHDLYPDLDTKQHWNENILDRLAKDTDLGMEKNEPLCKGKVPREGIVIRIDDDPLKEAFKLKCVKFLTRESKQIDAGNIDIELAQGNY